MTVPLKEKKDLQTMTFFKKKRKESPTEIRIDKNETKFISLQAHDKPNFMF